MKILFVAMSNSIHTARWVRQIATQGWDVRLFPVHNHGVVHPELDCIAVYHTLMAQRGDLDRKLRLQRNRFFRAGRVFLGLSVLQKLWPQGRLRQLLRVIDEFQPDIVHSLEFQASGYLTVAAKNEKPGDFPLWIATNWGSDIYYFRHFPEHEKKIRNVLEQCDYYSCECRRDVCLAEGMGLKGKVLPVLPNTGGFDLETVTRLRESGPASRRRIIVLKGYHHWVGRAIVGLLALERCADLLSGYEIVIHSASLETITAAKAFQKRTGIEIVLLKIDTPHESILATYGKARVAVGLSLSDGISTSFLEGLVMGAFPIQSWTACADEWITDGITGLLVPPEDVDAVALALRRALTEDSLVDQATVLNVTTAQMRLDRRTIDEKALEYYRTVAHDNGIKV